MWCHVMWRRDHVRSCRDHVRSCDAIKTADLSQPR